MASKGMFEIRSSSRNKLPFMILNHPEQTAEKKKVLLQKHGFSSRKMHFPAEKCTFLQKNALSCRKMRAHAGNRRKLQEGSRAQESRTLANFHKRSTQGGLCLELILFNQAQLPNLCVAGLELRTCNLLLNLLSFTIVTHISSPTLFSQNYDGSGPVFGEQFIST